MDASLRCAPFSMTDWLCVLREYLGELCGMLTSPSFSSPLQREGCLRQQTG